MDSYAALCSGELHIQPSIVSVGRIERLVAGKIQPSLVILKPADQVQQILMSAKLLRRSSDAHS
jgi:hypothetical protein